MLGAPLPLSPLIEVAPFFFARPACPGEGFSEMNRAAKESVLYGV
jgi:hypothetical protein